MESIVSADAIQPLIWCFEIGFKLNCIPLRWNREKFRVERVQDLKLYWKRYYLYRLLAGIHLLRNVVVPLYTLFRFLWDCNAQPPDVILGIFFMCIHIMSATAHSMFRYHQGASELTLNEIFMMVQVTGQFV